MIGFNDLTDMIVDRKKGDEMVPASPKGSKNEIRSMLEKCCKLCQKSDVSDPMEYLKGMLEEILGGEAEEPEAKESEEDAESESDSEEAEEPKGKRGALIVALLKKKKAE